MIEIAALRSLPIHYDFQHGVGFSSVVFVVPRLVRKCRLWNAVPYHFQTRSHYCGKQLLASSCLSVRLHGTTRRPLDEFSWSLNIFRKSVEKIQVSFESDKNYVRALYWKTDVCLWSYTAQFFFEWQMFWKNFVEKTKTHILWSTTFFSNIVPFLR
jgi:hypothetical protein